jgi:hypothetical protein
MNKHRLTILGYFEPQANKQRRRIQWRGNCPEHWRYISALIKNRFKKLTE